MLHEFHPVGEGHPTSTAFELIRTHGGLHGRLGLCGYLVRLTVFHQLGFGLEAHPAAATLVLLLPESKHQFDQVSNRISAYLGLDSLEGCE